MRAYWTLAGVVFGLLASGVASAAETKSQVDISLRKGEFAAHVVNRSYEIARYATEVAPRQIRTMLIELETDRTLVGEELDRQAGRVKVTATPVQGTKAAAKPAFTIALEGDTGHASGPYYLVTRYGCCAMGAAHTAYSLETGKLLFRYSGDTADSKWLTLLLKGSETEERILAAYLAASAADAEEFGADKSRALSLTYARPTRALQRIFVRLPPSVSQDAAAGWGVDLEWYRQGEPAGVSHHVLEGKGTAAEAATGIGLVVRLGGAREFFIPLHNDRLQIVGADVAPGFTLEEGAVP